MYYPKFLDILFWFVKNTTPKIWDVYQICSFLMCDLFLWLTWTLLLMCGVPCVVEQDLSLQKNVPLKMYRPWCICFLSVFPRTNSTSWTLLHFYMDTLCKAANMVITTVLNLDSVSCRWISLRNQTCDIGCVDVKILNWKTKHKCIQNILIM